MFIIREAQMKALSDHLGEQFVQAMAEHLRSDFRPYLRRSRIADESVEGLVREGLVVADDLGITDESDLQLFAECLALLGPSFHSDPALPWASESLHQPNWSGSARMDLIRQYLIFSFRDWV
jgi:hypothetical protein